MVVNGATIDESDHVFGMLSGINQTLLVYHSPGTMLYSKHTSMSASLLFSQDNPEHNCTRC
jgi:hypothetical protein